MNAKRKFCNDESLTAEATDDLEKKWNKQLSLTRRLPVELKTEDINSLMRIHSITIDQINCFLGKKSEEFHNDTMEQLWK